MTTFNAHEPCLYCGTWHPGRCPQVRRVEYYPDGSLKSVEFREEAPVPPLGLTTTGSLTDLQEAGL